MDASFVQEVLNILQASSNDRYGSLVQLIKDFKQRGYAQIDVYFLLHQVLVTAREYRREEYEEDLLDALEVCGSETLPDQRVWPDRVSDPFQKA